MKDLSEFSQQEPNTGCWLWARYANSFNQGLLQFRGRLRLASRVAYFLANGNWPDVVMHKCDQPLCVNPRHLVGGTQADNMRDASTKKRMQHGAEHWTHRTPEKIRMRVDPVRLGRVCSLLSGGRSQRSIARELGVSHATIVRYRRMAGMPSPGPGWKRQVQP
jgi:hypothetical protein